MRLVLVLVVARSRAFVRVVVGVELVGVVVKVVLVTRSTVFSHWPRWLLNGIKTMSVVQLSYERGLTGGLGVACGLHTSDLAPKKFGWSRRGRRRVPCRPRRRQGERGCSGRRAREGGRRGGGRRGACRAIYRASVLPSQAAAGRAPSRTHRRRRPVSLGRRQTCTDGCCSTPTAGPIGGRLQCPEGYTYSAGYKFLTHV